MSFSLGVTLATAASLFFSGVAAGTLNRRDDVRAVFTKSHWSSATTISFPGSDSFDAKTERWNAFDPPTYAVAVSPGSQSDLVKVVKLATAHSIPFLATGGRHGYTTTLGALDNGLAIDLSNFNSVKVNKRAATLTIGGAVRFRDIYDPVFEAGFEIQMGTCSCPGMVGVTLGGGVGPWGGVHGLLIDALLSLRVVTASGRVVHVSAKSNPDLFWAFRGAGANFGIVVSATYRLQKQVNRGQILVADMLFPAEKNVSYFNLLEAYNRKVPKGISISSFVLYNTTIGQAQIAASWAYIGPEHEGRKAFAPVFALKPISTNIQTFPWNKVITSGSGGIDAYICQPGLNHNIYEVNARKISSATYKSAFSKISAFYKNNPTARGSDILISIYANQAALAVPDSATAYAYRDTVAYNDIQFSWSGSNSTLEAITTALGRQLRSEFAATSGYSDLAVYLNSAHGDETLKQKYGTRKLPRLAALKKTWDPDRVFRYNNALPTRYP